MRRISAQYVFTSAGKPLRRGVVTAASDGTILSVEDTGGDLAEKPGTEFYNGIIIPGLVNCHTHLELSHMRNTLPAGGGLTEFITGVRQQRDADTAEIVRAARDADNEMYREGVVACGDISNNSLTFDIKRTSAIRYLTFIEVFGLDPLLATGRIDHGPRTGIRGRGSRIALSHNPSWSIFGLTAAFQPDKGTYRFIVRHIPAFPGV